MNKTQKFFIVIVSIFFLLIINFNIFATEKNSKEVYDLLKKFDTSTYHPEVFGLKDLAADVRFSNFDKEIGNQLGQLKIDDLYFTIYWLASGKVDVEISGLPKGFVMVKDTLIRSVQVYIDFIIPKTFADKAKNYEIRPLKDAKEIKEGEKLEKGERLFIGTDKTHLNMVHEIKMVFDDKDRLQKLFMLTPQGTEDTYFTWEKEKWSQNKWVLSSIILKSDYGIQSKIVRNDITYNSFSGIGLPIRVSINTEVFTKNVGTTKTNTEKKNSKSSDSIFNIQRELIISNYRINSGEAQKYFLKKM
ncbi:MAG: hypothetical protein HQK51_15490 [Oligoflexia bacterium]|nr:hypothetical protein [Oligoflexia bacterium]